MIEINPDRLMTDLRALRKIGADGRGVKRLAFSDTDIAARRWIAGRLDAAGLAASLDSIGNVYGRSRRAERAVLLGSHTDTVPTGGWLDGALGVVYGLEIARAHAETPARHDVDAIGVDVIDFQDEEGTVSPFLGSRAFCGELSAAEAIAMMPASSALAQAASDPLIHRFEPGRHLAYLEAHIEQGPRLEAASRRIGIVQGIVGIRRFHARATGRADHAGTTPMAMRRDAGHALFTLMEHVYREFPALAGPDTVWNIGSVSLRPGAANVVPQSAEMQIECRDLDDAVLDRLEGSLLARVQAHNTGSVVAIDIERTYCIAPVPMARSIIENIESAAQRLRMPGLAMPSGAGHDAMILAGRVPAGMMFIPSIGGRSHAHDEDSTEADIVAGCRVFAAAVDGLLAAGSNARNASRT